MSSANTIRFREARDRIIDLLGFAETYPVRDLPVRDERLTVLFGSTAKIPVETSQKGVEYGLRTKEDAAVGATVTGDGDTIQLETPRITEDITYTVRAVKPTGRTAPLIETATVKVGIDVGLKATLLPPVPKPPIVDFGSSVEIEIAESQEGVDYRLVHFPNGEPADPESMVSANADPILSQGDTSVRGTGATIRLRTKPMAEDTVIRIRAIKMFDSSEGQPPRTNILRVPLPLFVRADLGLKLAVEPAPILDYLADGRLRIGKTQVFTTYEVFARAVADGEFRQGAPAGAPGTVRVPVAGEEDAVIATPALPADGGNVPDFRPVGDAQAGTGGDLVITLPRLGTDTFVIVRAAKKHAVPHVGDVPSAVWLATTAVALTRPDPKPKLSLAVVIRDGKTTGSLFVAGGQPGVFYAPRALPAGPAFALPAYIHQRDASLNKGLGQLKLGVDFVIAGGEPAGPSATTPPATPELTGDPLAVGTRLALRAMKAQTRVAGDLADQAEIMEPPGARLDAALIDFGGEARVIVQASRTGETYTLRAVGAVLVPPQDGTGQDLTLLSGALREDTVIELAALPKGGAIPVERRVPFAVTVRPDPSLSVSAREAQVPKNGATAILVSDSQLGVGYTLWVANAAVGTPVAGDGDDIVLPTGPIAATTTFGVRAAKTAAPDIAVILAATAQVTVVGG